jgi:uncharacterized repeat protein (TIGR03803 family)
MKHLPSLFVLSAVLVIVLSAAPSQLVQAQTFQVLHTFTGGPDGNSPRAGVTVDRAGNLYGTAYQGGKLTCDAPWGCGEIYLLKHAGSNWVFHPLYSFTWGTDGKWPASRIVFGPDGALYGSTYEGGGDQCGDAGCGTVFKVQPPAAFCRSVSCPWPETVLYAFNGDSDGYWPWAGGDLHFDQSGNIYGTTPYTTYGSNVYGVVYELTRSGSGYTESVLHAFSNSDGSQPLAGVISDTAGNLYGTTVAGGLFASGTVFELTYVEGVGWTEIVLHNFTLSGNDGGSPYAGLISDQAGNLYGATYLGGPQGGGAVFELSPGSGGWTFNVLYTFTTGGCGPQSSLTMDAAGNLYGATLCGGANHFGSIFKLALVNGAWTYTSLHDFAGADGDNPVGVTLDGSGNLYGATIYGGNYSGLCQHDGCGVVWEITP